VSETALGRSSIIMPSLVEIGEAMWKCIKRKQTHIIYTHREIYNTGRIFLTEFQMNHVLKRARFRHLCAYTPSNFLFFIGYLTTLSIYRMYREYGSEANNNTERILRE
jgi:hypothetical protein